MNAKHPQRQLELIKFYAPRELKEEALKLADDRNISLSAMLRLILTEYIKKKG